MGGKTHHLRKHPYTYTVPGDSSRALFGMVSSRDPFKWLGLYKWPPTGGWKGHGLNHLVVVPSQIMNHRCFPLFMCFPGQHPLLDDASGKPRSWVGISWIWLILYVLTNTTFTPNATKKYREKHRGVWLSKGIFLTRFFSWVDAWSPTTAMWSSSATAMSCGGATCWPCCCVCRRLSSKMWF